jgi:hypothetical protein
MSLLPSGGNARGGRVLRSARRVRGSTLAAKDLAGSLPQIGTLVISPDMLAPLLAKLAS